MTTTRRDFIKAGAALAAGTLAAAAPAQAGGAPGRDTIEIRRYRLRTGASSALLDAYLEKALIPALNARGVAAVGVFTEPQAPDGASVWVVFAHPEAQALLGVDAGLNADPAVKASAGAYLATAKDAPAFDRVDTWLHLSFEGQPRLKVPRLATEGKDRVFEMRTYESHNEERALKKVAMFNAGEIGVMTELNLSPVFYGQALVGRDLPHLTYLLCSPDMDTHKKNWKAFGAHPVWLALKGDPQYAETVSKITSRFLVPARYSQI
jgi:NIPSNAP